MEFPAKIRRAAATGTVRLLAVLLSMSTAASGGAEDSPVPARSDCRPFQRAMIFSGQGTDFTAFIGMYDAAVDAGRPPDLILATSGGAIAALIVGSFPERADRNAFLSSPAFHEMMLSIHIDHPESGPFWLRSFVWRLRSVGIAPMPPHIFTRPIASKPRNFGIPEADRPFGSNPNGPRVIFIAGQCEFDGRLQRRPGRKLFTETWFTDGITAVHLAGLGSGMGAKYPRSAIRCQSKTVADATVNDAMQASISEPYIFSPFRLEGHFYTGGAVNLWPCELADQLARETIVPKQGPFCGAVEALIAGVFEYSPAERRRDVDRLPVACRVDLSDSDEFTRDYSFWFKLKVVSNVSEVQAYPGGQPRPDRPYPFPRPNIVQSVPEDAAEFHRRLNLQWQYGYDRTRAAFAGKAK